MRAIMKLLLPAALLCTASCSNTFDTTQAAPAEYQAPSIDLYLSRATFSHTSFEQFKFANKVLFAECGRIAGGRQFAQYQNVFKLNDEESESLRQMAFRISEFEKQFQLKLDESGDSDSMFDPGQYILQLDASGEKNRITTSLDSIATPTKNSTELLNQLAQGLRNISIARSNSSTLCGNRTFFDLGAKNPVDVAG